MKGWKGKGGEEGFIGDNALPVWFKSRDDFNGGKLIYFFTLL